MKLLSLIVIATSFTLSAYGNGFGPLTDSDLKSISTILSKCHQSGKYDRICGFCPDDTTDPENKIRKFVASKVQIGANVYFTPLDTKGNRYSSIEDLQKAFESSGALMASEIVYGNTGCNNTTKLTLMSDLNASNLSQERTEFNFRFSLESLFIDAGKN